MRNYEVVKKTNQNIVDYLSYYFSDSTEVDYAILLNGPWGSGKTYFVKNEILYENSGDDRLYITLNGVSSISEITDQFFTQLHPKLSSKSFKIIGILASRTINGIAGTDVAKDENDKALLQDLFLKLRNKTIIFDDLERCLIPIQSILGYINFFVEHEKCKVLIVASEADIPKKQIQEYFLKKEKTIGKTISLTPPLSEVILFFNQSMINSLAKEIVQKNIKNMIKIIAESGSLNFRSIRSIFSDFERIVINFELYFLHSEVALTKLLYSLLAIGIEHKAGKLTYDEISDLPTNSFNYTLAKSNSNKTNEIIEKYTTVEWFDPVIPYGSIARIFETGIIDRDDIILHLQQHPLLTRIKESQFWRELWAWNELTRSDYLRALEGLKTQLENFELLEPEIILHVVGISLSLESSNERSLTSEEDITTYFIRYIDEIKKRDLLLPDVAFFTDTHHSKYNLGFICSNKQEFKIIKQHLKLAVTNRFYSSQKKGYPDLLYLMSHSSAEYTRLYEYGLDEGNYGGFPFLHLIPPGYFAHMIINDWKCNGALLSSILERYSRDRHSKNLFEEYAWVKKLKKITYNIAGRAEEPHKTQLLNRLAYYFDLIESNIEQE
ncbi:TPA: hypothetical protein O8U20_002352 [Enterobacter cloacae]|uniref:P-loop NTPase fold protein n=1 Tax=Enterobacter cloacae TaxID=550 RepID=UPI000B8C8D36|nr:P-loop NTPase fold protein [Enterobacter cloacae]MCM2486828.1 KAP family NTPase [Enterobacter cloacae]OXU40518.1 hypothetical protein BME83_04315 [Enterobacter cloacae subsp. cloacae]HBC2537832.1 hypothetical protein [Enterobacter cloacae]HCR1075841.1 hypothetical protein [Enterobacter cloacae]HDC4405554.1 hypothetical protein [Enterobacter cloacae]